MPFGWLTRPSPDEGVPAGCTFGPVVVASEPLTVAKWVSSVGCRTDQNRKTGAGSNDPSGSSIQRDGSGSRRPTATASVAPSAGQSYALYLTDGRGAGGSDPCRADAVDLYGSGVRVTQADGRGTFPYERVRQLREGSEVTPDVE